MKNLVLIGMPATGKSTVGVLLAKTLNLAFVDTDLLLQRQEGKTLSELIAEEKLAGFLKKEQALLESLVYQNTCIATGGSAVYAAKAMCQWKESGVFVCLDLPVAEIENRIADIKTRGVAIETGKTLGDLYRERKPLYEKYADFTVRCGGKLPEEIVLEIAGFWNRNSKSTAVNWTEKDLPAG